MAHADWSVVCDMAYFDASDRLCAVGVDTGPVRAMVIGSQRLALVVRLADRDEHDDLRPALFVTSPSGAWRVADDVLDFSIESRGDYVIVHIPGLRVAEDGAYRFELALGTSAPAMIEFSVQVAVGRTVRTRPHGSR